MRKYRCILFVLPILALLVSGSRSSMTTGDPGPLDELDAYWAEVARTVAEGDFDGYSATYHPDAVLVSMASESTYPISKALDGWKTGFDDTKAGKMEASVEFRFTQRLNDETTAHETGIFHYTATPADGKPDSRYIRFEALLVKKGHWLVMMEYQKTPATADEWNAAK